MKITLPDGSIRELADGSSGLDLASDIGPGLAKAAVAVIVNGIQKDLSDPIDQDSEVSIITIDSDEGLEIMRHTLTAQVLARAVKNLYPDTKLAIGPTIADGFYYDFEFKKAISPDDLASIEKEMKKIISNGSSITKTLHSKSDAMNIFKGVNESYKESIISESEQDDNFQLYYQDNNEFVDLCRGPHLPSLKHIGAFRLTKLAGAYWKGDSKNKMLTRIYGTAWKNEKELNAYLLRIEEAEKRDHRKLGRELELFTFSEKVGMGLPLWLPKGTLLRERLINFMKKAQDKSGYQQVTTPHIGHKALYETSGHYEKYGKDSFQPITTPHEGEAFLLKPMNCPHHCEIYKHKPRSYKDLPIRYAEFGTVYRYEQSGELHGLTRVRGFTQDDAHIFCRPDQVKEEFIKVIDLVLYVFKALGFSDYTAQISLRDPENKQKYIGSDEAWDKAEAAIIEASAEKGLETVTELGEAAFYGPKLDFMVKDALGRKWQLGTIQVDYQLPDRFQLEYIGSDNQKHRPVMIHRAPFGSLERFVAVLIEHCAGDFPLWLAPEQINILPISEKFISYAEELKGILDEAGITGTIDNRDEKIGRKIRDSEVRKVPFMLIVGEKEQEEGKVAVRKHGQGDLGVFSPAEFIQYFKGIISESLAKE